MALRIADIDAHGLVPAIGRLLQPRIKRGPQLGYQVRQRIGKIFVLTAAEAVTPHHDAAAEMRIVGIERRERAAFVRREQALQHRATLRVEFAFRRGPVDRIDAGGDGGGNCGNLFRVGFHGRMFANRAR